MRLLRSEEELSRNDLQEILVKVEGEVNTKPI